MDKKDKGPLSWLKNVLSSDGNEKKQGKTTYIVIVVLFGAAIMLLSNMFFKDNKAQEVAAYNNEASSEEAEETFGQKANSSNLTIADYEEQYKKEIKEAISAIAGVKDAIVYVNIEGSEKKVYEKNQSQTIQKTEEKDTQGGNRNVEETSNEETVVLVPNGDKQVPLVVETMKPKIAGVLVVAKGAGDIKVKTMIVEAVTRALDVPSHRVSVQPKQN
ncbi:mutants block sporulation after engulfment [Niallia circulans]|jgi:stage III sporulation protein AG|uniref:Stage III sporulation protein AG n=1 Tax=Niallia circulans TaxID=1397 RepID=A0A0J1IME9_NIACI|nr:stage III sporulation protein AG [Niallia circulans]KLV27166.1 stage III sporulation protein AG [Niallia circulans]MCM2980830.1 stage III sporulation protein AG [Niallia circulans]MDR4314452.1 stage III sporulation protein AG [Niallia circulans]MED3839536.1 stage III sporulation protein AG [Niallia circulans]MED4242608.1 stage III sporulation protein AG [Niallia circulans]